MSCMKPCSAVASAAPPVRHDDVLDSGCCMCVQQLHKIGPSRSDNEAVERQRSANLRAFFALAAFAAWSAAAALVIWDQNAAAGCLLPIAAIGSALCVRDMRRFHEAIYDATGASADWHPRAALAAADDAAAEPGEAALLMQGSGLVEWCGHCEAHVRRPSAHCRACGRCVSLMDHHCSLLLCCVGADNRHAYSRLIGRALAINAFYLVLAIARLRGGACGALSANELWEAARRFDFAAVAAPLLALRHRPECPECATATTLAVAAAYAVAALGAFALQQVAFVLLVSGGASATAGGDGRLWLLRRVMRIPYWTKQREQVLKLGRRGLASALAREIALNI